MLDEEKALLAAICAQPDDDDTPRLVYADWLQEHGREERAEHIRLQVREYRHHRAMAYLSALKRMHYVDENEISIISRRIHRLENPRIGEPPQHLEQNSFETWERELELPIGVALETGKRWERGFPRRVIFSSVEAFLRHGAEVLEKLPAVAVSFNERLTPDKMQLVLDHLPPNMRHLYIVGANDAEVSELSSHRALAQLDTLTLQGISAYRNNERIVEENPASSITDAALHHLLGSPCAHFKSLDIMCNQISDASVLRIATAPSLSDLKALNIDYNFLSDDGRTRLAGFGAEGGPVYNNSLQILGMYPMTWYTSDALLEGFLKHPEILPRLESLDFRNVSTLRANTGHKPGDAIAAAAIQANARQGELLP